MWSKQKESGIIEGWHGDGNFARTTIMYCLWKTGGTHPEPWRTDLEIGAVQEDSLLYLNCTAASNWEGRIMFDRKRHSDFLHLPLDWPRINQFPEYFTIENSKNYNIQFADGSMRSDTLKGEELFKGFPLSLRKGNTMKIIVKPLKHSGNISCRTGR